MKTQISYRKFQKEDAEAIEEIIIEAWHYNDLCSKKTAHKMAKVFLSSCLTNQTYTQVALLDNKPIGVMMAKNNNTHTCPFKYRIKQIIAITSLYLSREGRKVSKIFSSVSEIDKELIEESQKQYQGEVAFFAVSSIARGKGLGKKMFCDMLEYMKSQDIDSFYLFTDTSCNYGFYEHQGMTRRNEKSNRFWIQGKEAKMTFFIYDYFIHSRNKTIKKE